MFYALSDSFTGDLPKDYTYGFANTAEPIAFRTRKERDEWLAKTKLQKAKKLTRPDALKMIKSERGDYMWVVKRVRIGLTEDYVTIKG